MSEQLTIAPFHNWALLAGCRRKTLHDPQSFEFVLPHVLMFDLDIKELMPVSAQTPSCQHPAGCLVLLSDTPASRVQVFREMVWKGCERSVITYSSLISACEKAGQWRLALDMFQEMHNEGCRPNTVTYNSLITACGQGELELMTRSTLVLQ